MNAIALQRPLEDVIYALVASPNFMIDKLCYAACQSGLQMSEDGGLTWRSALDSLDVPTLPTATAVAVSPNFQSDQTLFVGVPGGFLTSTDAGITWTTAALPTPAPFITAIAASPDYAHDGVVLAGSMEDGVFVSEEYGKHWNAWNFGLLDQNIFCLCVSPDFSRDKQVFVGTESGIFTSKNRGRSWRATDFPGEFAPVLSLALSPAFGQDGILWAGTEAHGLWYSQDFGSTWEQIGQAGSVSAIILSPAFPQKLDILMVLDDVLLISRDLGQRWSPLTIPADAAVGLTAVIAPMGIDVGSSLLIGSDEGIVSTAVR